MEVPNANQILRLYRQLLKYGKNLQFTDKDYFQKRIRHEFKQNKSLTNVDDVIFNFKVCYDISSICHSAY